MRIFNQALTDMNQVACSAHKISSKMTMQSNWMTVEMFWLTKLVRVGLRGKNFSDWRQLPWKEQPRADILCEQGPRP